VAKPTLLVLGCDRAVARLSQSSPVARAMVQLWRTLTKTTGVHTEAALPPGGDVVCCLYGAPPRVRSCSARVPFKMKSPFAAG
jgi:hypothetical protein